MKKIVLIGGFGFLGKNLQKAFSDQSKFEVHSLSRRNGYDLLEKNAIKEALETIKPDYVFNCAAHVGSLDYVSRLAADVIAENMLLGINLWEILRDIQYKGVVINPISNCTYPGKASVQQESEWWDGMVHPSIISYGSAKKAIFMLNRCYEQQYGIRTLNLIMPNAYGEDDYLEVSRVHALNGIVIRMLQMQKDGKKQFDIWGTGTPIREWGYMPDIARVMYEIVDRDLTDLPNPLNIGQERGYSINEVAAVVKKLIDDSIQTNNDTTKQDGDPIKVLGGSEFKQHFPDFEFTPLEVGIQNTINYYRESL